MRAEPRSTSSRLAIAAGVLAAVSAGLAWMARGPDMHAHDRVNATISQVSAYDSAVKQLVLAARQGAVTQYDALVAHAAGLGDAQVATDDAIRRALGPTALRGERAALAEAVATRQALVRQFKPAHAIYRNSLRYLPVGVRAVATDAATPVATREAVSALMRDVLGAHLSPTASARTHANAALTAWQGVAAPGVQTMLGNHAQRVLTGRAQLEPVTTAVLDDRVEDALDRVQDAYTTQFRAGAEAQRVWTYALYAWGVVLIGLLLLSAHKLSGLYRTLEHKVRARTADLAAKNSKLKQVFDTVGDGFLSAGPDGTLHAARSLVLDGWFGAEDAVFVWDLFAGSDPKTAAWLELSWGELFEGVLPLELCLDQLPDSTQKDGRTYALSYHPIQDAGAEPTGLVVVVRDVTDELERKAAEGRQAALVAIFHRVLHDRAGFVNFFEEAHRLINTIATAKSDSAHLRALHTLKGNAAMFGLSDIASWCHDAESHHAGSGQRADVAGLQEKWAALEHDIGVLLQPEHQKGVDVPRDELESVIGALRASGAAEALWLRMKAWQLEPVENRLERARVQVEGLASRLGKPIDVQVEADEVRLERDVWNPFWTELVHVLRNAVDHGIEPSAVRVARGKAETGKLTLRAQMDEVGLTIAVTDDGAGIDWAYVAQKATARGLPVHDTAALTAAIFADGFSTHDVATALSGRGIGLGAMRRAVEELGGRIAIDTMPEEGTTVRFMFPTALLPQAATATRVRLAS